MACATVHTGAMIFFPKVRALSPHAQPPCRTIHAVGARTRHGRDKALKEEPNITYCMSWSEAVPKRMLLQDIIYARVTLS